jgi:coenzyme F420-reducing hydrogenase delta subunit
MTAPVAPAPDTSATTRQPRILVFSTNNISDPGIDLAGSSHLHYDPGVRVVALPCTSLIKPAWVLHAIERGFDGVFIASDGEECGYLPDCAERASHNVSRAQALLKEAGHSPQRVRMAAVCSVCAEPFAKHVAQFSEALAALEPSGAR